MKANQKLAWAALCGLVIGAAGVKTLYAQAGAPPAYVIVEQGITDRDTFQKFAKSYSALLASYNAKILAGGGRTVALFGAPPLGQVGLVEFPRVADAERFYASPEYAQIKLLRDHSVSAKSRTFIVEGLSP
jgi:uncharacterized protein (DUF1330 family)